MENFVAFANSLLHAVSEFLLTEPVIWFLGVILVASVGKLISNLIHL